MTVRLITFNGKTQRVIEWAREIGMSSVTLNRRLQQGWSIEDALTLPPRAFRANRPTRCIRPIIFDGRTQSLSAWAREIGIRPTALMSRLRKGWPIERALTAPLHHRRLPLTLTFEGITQSIDDWAADYGVPAKLIQQRLYRGWDAERAITMPMPVTKGMKLPAPTANRGVDDDFADMPGDRRGERRASLNANRVFAE
jgi:hypothetical protein